MGERSLITNNSHHVFQACGKKTDFFLNRAYAPPPAAGPNQFSAASPSFSRSGIFTGRISFSTSSGSMRGYLSRFLDRNTGLLMTTQDPSHALQVQWTPSSLPAPFEVLVWNMDVSTCTDLKMTLNSNRTAAVRIDSWEALPETQRHRSVTALPRKSPAA